MLQKCACEMFVQQMITLSANSGILTSCCPATITHGRKKIWLKAFCLPQHPATFVPLHICQDWCPIARCQAGKSAPCHFWNDNLSLSQVCYQFVPYSHSLPSKKDLKIKPANLKAQTCMQSLKLTILQLSGDSEIEDISFIATSNAKFYFKTANPCGILLDSMTKCQFQLTAK